MEIVLGYIDRKGCVIEQFLGLNHVASTSADSLKKALEELFSKHRLSISQFRGQGYDGASNMKGEFNGLKAIILKENDCAYYVHCFAHQLQLALVAVAKNHVEINSLFYKVSNVVNIVLVTHINVKINLERIKLPKLFKLLIMVRFQVGKALIKKVHLCIVVINVAGHIIIL